MADPYRIIYMTGLGQDVSDEDVRLAFGAGVIKASCVPRDLASKRCIGHAFLTVAAHDVVHCLAVTQVGPHRINLQQVEISSWTAATPPPTPTHSKAAAATNATNSKAAASRDTDAGGTGDGGGDGGSHGQAPPAAGSKRAASGPAEGHGGPNGSAKRASAATDSAANGGGGDGGADAASGGAGAGLSAAAGAAGPPPAAAPNNQSPTSTTANNTGGAALPPGGQPGQVQDSGGWGPVRAQGQAVMGAPPPRSAPMPVIDPKLPHLAAVFDQLQKRIAAGGQGGYNGKTPVSVLTELSQKLKVEIRAHECQQASTFICRMQLLSTSHKGVIRCAEEGSANSKKGAKQVAAAVVLNKVLSLGVVTEAAVLERLLSDTHEPMPLALAVAPPPSVVRSVAAVQAEAVFSGGPYKRAAKLVYDIQSAPGGRDKTIMVIMHDYVGKSKNKLEISEVADASGGGGGGAGGGVGGLGAGRFTFMATLRNQEGQEIAKAIGQPYRTKQDARQGAAAALMEYLLERDTMDTDLILPKPAKYGFTA